MRIIWNFLKYTLLVILLLISTIVIGGDMGVLNYFKKPIASVVKLSTGRDLRIGGDIRLKLIPFDKAHLIINDLHFSNHKEAKNNDLFAYKKLRVDFSFADLMTRGYFNASKLELVDPVMNFEKFANGENSFSFGKSSAKKKKHTKMSIPHISISDGRIVNANINVLSGKDTTNIKNMNINMNIGSLLGPFDVNGSANFDGQKLNLKAKSGMVKEGKSNVDIAITKGANKLIAVGRYDLNKGSFNGNLKANAILREIGLKDINIDEAGINPSSAIKADVDVRLDNANSDNIKLKVAKLELSLGKQRLSGDANIAYNQSNPKVSGAINLKTLKVFYKSLDKADAKDKPASTDSDEKPMFNLQLVDKPKDSKGFSLNNYLSPYYENFEEPSKIPGKPFPWPNDEINLEALSGIMDMDLKLNIHNIQYNDIDINNSVINIKKEASDLKAELNLDIMGGKNNVAANLKLVDSGVNGSVNIDSQIKNIEKFSDNKFKGNLALKANVLLNGNSLKEIISNLDGHIDMKVNKAVLVGYDIGTLLKSGGMINLLTGGVVNLVSDLSNPVGLISGVASVATAAKGLSGETPFKHVIASVKIKSGVANIEKAALIAKPIKIMVEHGTINIKNAGMDVLAKLDLPGLNKDAKTKLRLNGPFSEVAIGLHEESAKKVADMLTNAGPTGSKSPLGVLGKVANPLNATPIGIIGNVIGGAAPKSAPAAGSAGKAIGGLGKLLGGL